MKVTNKHTREQANKQTKTNKEQQTDYRGENGHSSAQKRFITVLKLRTVKMEVVST